MDKGLLQEKSIETLIQNTRRLFCNGNGYYHKAMQISESITTYKDKGAEQQLYSVIKELKSNFIRTLKKLITILDYKDKYTKNHCQRVTKITLTIGAELGFSNEDLLFLEFAALLHDIGKVAIPSDIINKEGRLTQEEYDIIKLHPSIGYQLIKDIELLSASREILLQHHERIDGKGYPKGLDGSQIDMKAKVLAVADAYDAMTSSRPYRKAGMSAAEAIKELEKNIGTQFEPVVVTKVIELIRAGIIV